MRGQRTSQLPLLVLLALSLSFSLTHARAFREVYRFGLFPASLDLLSFSSSSSGSMSDAVGSADPKDHEYFRPTGGDVSGFPKNSAKYHRSPCPALNTLANHGYLPRDGKNLTPEMLAKGVMEVFNIDKSLADTLTSGLPANFTLADLGEHNFIEHDASLVHDDAYFGRDPSQVNTTLVKDLLSKADSKGQITKSALAHYRHWREQQCAKDDPKYGLSLKQQLVAFGESALVLIAFGHYDTETVSVASAQSFLEKEQIPDGFAKSTTPISRATAVYLAIRLKWLATFG